MVGRTCVVLTLLAANAAAGERAVVGGLELAGAARGTELEASLRAGLVEGLKAGGLAVVADAEVKRKTQSVPGLTGCETMGCLREIAERVGVKSVVRGRVEVTGSNYAIALELVSPSGEKAVEHADDSCQVCTIAEARQSMVNAGFLLASRHAGTAAPPVPDEARARALDQAGSNAFAAGRFDEAARDFEDAYTASQRPSILWNIAQAYRRQYEIDHDLTKLRRARVVLRNFTSIAPTSAERGDADALGREIDDELARRNAPPVLATTPGVTAPLPATTTATPAATQEVAKKPLYRRWQLWLGVGLGAAAIIGVAIAVGVTQSGGTDFWSRAQSGCMTPNCQVADFR